MKKFLCNWLLSFLLPAVVYGGGSSYSRYGKGDILFFGGSRAYALGGCGIATLNTEYLNQFNPAGLSKLLLTQFAASFENTTISSHTQNQGAAKYNTFGFQSFFVAIPVSIENGIGLSLEYTPYSRVAYAVRKTSLQEGYLFTNTYYGNGGIASIALGLSFSLTQNIHAGVKVANYYGRTEQYTKADFESSDLTNSEYEYSHNYNGFAGTFGVIVEHVGKELGVQALEPLTVGITFSPPAKLTTDVIAYYPAFDTSIVKKTGTSDIPFSLGFGVSYRIDSRYQVVSDLQFQDWKNAPMIGQNEPTLRNAIRFGIGCERLPERRQSSFWQRTAYRIGGYYHQTYYTLNGTGIDEIGITAGLGIPVGAIGKLDLGFQYGVRGTTATNLQKDTFYRISLGLTVSERWFLQFEEE